MTVKSALDTRPQDAMFVANVGLDSQQAQSVSERQRTEKKIHEVVASSVGRSSDEQVLPALEDSRKRVTAPSKHILDGIIRDDYQTETSTKTPCFESSSSSIPTQYAPYFLAQGFRFLMPSAVHAVHNVAKGASQLLEGVTSWWYGPVVSQESSFTETVQKEKAPVQQRTPSPLELGPNRPLSREQSPDGPSHARLPTVHNLVQKYRSRSWGEAHDVIGGRDMASNAYLYTHEEHEADKRMLLRVLGEHNILFKDRIDAIEKDPEAIGVLEKFDAPTGSSVFVRADLHSDLKTLLAQLDMLKEKGFLDEQYHCRPDFHMVFLGDYMDRGHNDVEVLTLLLALRMENPKNIHLLLGNHEDVSFQQDYSAEPAWLEQNEEIIRKCYQTFPVMYSIADHTGRADREGRKEYVQFLHGNITTFLDPVEFLESEASMGVLKKEPTPSSSSRLQELAQKPEANLAEVRHIESAKMLCEAREREMRVLTWQRMFAPKNLTVKDSIVWSDSANPGISFQRSTRGPGMIVPPELIQAYLRARGTKARVASLIHGHGHIFRQTEVRRKSESALIRQPKIIETTLSVGTIGGMYAKNIGSQPVQGFLLTVAPRAREWKKQPIICQSGADDTFVVGSSVGLYDKISS